MATRQSSVCHNYLTHFMFDKIIIGCLFDSDTFYCFWWNNHKYLFSIGIAIWKNTMFNNGSLSLLANYGSDSSDNDVPGPRVSTKRTHKSDNDELSEPVSKKTER